LISTAELLITINSLTYSKINISTKEGRSSNHDIRKNDSASTSIDLSALIEDSVDTLIAGNHFRAISASSDGSGESQDRVRSYERRTSLIDVQQGPLVNLTIEHCSSWHVLTEAPVWARCVMNVLGNALKYTESGIIEVRLGWAPAPAGESRDNTKVVRLSISDTGRGISSAYLRSHLYQPFLQENASSTGLGLGLSIVKKLIDGLDGSINIQSVLDEGTRVEITVPVSVEPLGERGDPTNLRHAGKKICCVGEPHKRGFASNVDMPLPSRENSSAAVSSALSLYCRQWFDMAVSYAATPENVVADVMVVFEEDLESIRDSNFSGTGKAKGAQHPRCALLVIATTSATNRRPNPSKTDGIFYLAPPFGPRRLAAVVQQALEYTDKINDGTITITPKAKDLTINGPFASRTKDRAATAAITTAAIARTAAPKLPTKDPNQQPSPHTLTALIVDDNAINLSLLEKCLQRWQITYKTASNGKQAVEAFQNPANTFDYILMDISMPVMNGIEAARLIREWESAQSQPLPSRARTRARIIAMTGLGDDRTRQEALASGIDVFLTKPIRLRDVKTLLEVT